MNDVHAGAYDRFMPGEFFFMAIAGLGVSLAGFAGLIAALDPSSGSAVRQWRIRNIVVSGFFLTFMGFGTIATHTLTSDVAVTVRIISAVAAVVLLARFLKEIRPGPAWPDRRGLVIASVMGLSVIGLLVVNSVIASVGFLQLLMLLELTDPASIFLFTVRDL
ncbi:MAG TPA: hypothetical protein VK845_07700 [Gemmatimonadales bacterium]|nr:hypothetical protein [Gemmatimonadales bacterium]